MEWKSTSFMKKGHSIRKYTLVLDEDELSTLMNTLTTLQHYNVRLNNELIYAFYKLLTKDEYYNDEQLAKLKENKL